MKLLCQSTSVALFSEVDEFHDLKKTKLLPVKFVSYTYCSVRIETSGKLNLLVPIFSGSFREGSSEQGVIKSLQIPVRAFVK